MSARLYFCIINSLAAGEPRQVCSVAVAIQIVTLAEAEIIPFHVLQTYS